MARPSHVCRFGSGHPKLSSTVTTEFSGFICTGLSNFTHRGFLLSARHVPTKSSSTIGPIYSTKLIDTHPFSERHADGGGQPILFIDLEGADSQDSVGRVARLDCEIVTFEIKIRRFG
ncbi:hypothetical protein M407DRAFT_29754 [Tulasnella calospora MUT 4182]|uniref:Uncharacterized protein n=1 Tax=Tulasnella calospora MUT 4182 TaxID=1051891 RepID=A0A0C3PYY1_9AGAM|nr:hypothetical protein M407DRAFT_29754 [Tulasnella calospora MUT 4182]